MVEGPAKTETITCVACPGIWQDVICPDNSFIIRNWEFLIPNS